MDWNNPPAEVDHFKLMYTDPSGQEEEQDVQRSQEARTRHTIVGTSDVERIVWRHRSAGFVPLCPS